jgi:hypothetical protein
MCADAGFEGEKKTRGTIEEKTAVQERVKHRAFRKPH